MKREELESELLFFRNTRSLKESAISFKKLLAEFSRLSKIEEAARECPKYMRHDLGCEENYRKDNYCPCGLTKEKRKLHAALGKEEK